jgi:hypothetical protein
MIAPQMDDGSAVGAAGDGLPGQSNKMRRFELYSKKGMNGERGNLKTV